MKKLINNNFNHIEKSLFFLERNQKYKNVDRNVLLDLAFKFINFSSRTKDLRYLNLALKIRDVIPKNIILNLKIDELINKIKKFK